ncbi:response regulator [Mangrovimonas sp. DI 80]|uniref:response regulator n=1 Tax=Mangrovimonas sp. DI 80 TaxID=1779330 RepID=UPI000976BED6|nr:response regulator [Mangrovimonas sp. DI 80]OMP29897.1 response regulator [Mangrovimonas sp. DI 80]
MEVLIVDDERDIETLFRQKFRREVRNQNLELLFAFSGSEALDILERENPPKVVYVFSDINMPGMTGLELLDKIKSQFPNITVSMISAYGDSDNFNRAIQSGAKEFFTKPIDFESLRKEIHQML